MNKASQSASRAGAEAMEISRENIAAMTEMLNVVTTVSKELAAEMVSYMNKQFAQNAEMGKQVMSCRTLNDMFDFSTSITKANLDAILAELGKRKIKAVLLGMLSAPNLGADYRAKFDPIYPALAKKHEAALVPFFLQPLIDKPELIQPDHIHPTLPGIDLLVGSTVAAVAEALPKSVPATPR